MNDDSIQALREADWRKTNVIPVDYGAIRDRIVESPIGSGCESRHHKRASVRRRAISAVGVGALAVALALGAIGLLGEPSAQPAYAAVKQAIAKTVELGTSGTIITSLQASRADGKPEEPLPSVSQEMSASDLGSTFKWNGDDFELSGPRNLRLVGGELYGGGDDGEWWHLGSFGSSPAAGGIGSGMSDWLESSKRAYAPERIGALVERLDSLEKDSLEDGSALYTGKTTVEVIRECFGKGYAEDSNDVTGMMLPKNIPADTQIRVQLTIGADNILREWTGSYSATGADFVFAPVGTNGGTGYQYPDHVVYDFVFTVKYKDIGSTPSIEKPGTVKEQEPEPSV